MAGQRILLLLFASLALLSVYVRGSLLDEVIDNIIVGDKKNSTAAEPPPQPADNNSSSSDSADMKKTEDKKDDIVAKAKETVSKLENLQDMTEKEQENIERLLELLSKNIDEENKVGE